MANNLLRFPALKSLASAPAHRVCLGDIKLALTKLAMETESKDAFSEQLPAYVKRLVEGVQDITLSIDESRGGASIEFTAKSMFGLFTYQLEMNKYFFER